MKYYVGIDPGETGGLGIVDQDGHYVAALRWDRRRPVTMFERLMMIRDQVVLVYLEKVAAFPQEGMGHVVSTIPLSVNWGIWKGFLLVAGLDWVEVSPPMWQAAWHLSKWQQTVKRNGSGPTPLTVARERYPEAPLDHLVDDGKAVGLLLAGLARWDWSRGMDRGAAIQAQATKIRAQKKVARAQAKALKTLANNTNPNQIGPPASSDEPILWP